jgi:prolyl oligopeptidase
MRLFLILLMMFLFATKSNSQNNYPLTKTVDSSDTYWGKTYKDPYRWLENLKAQDVIDWYKNQAEYTNSILNRISNRDKLIDRYKELDAVLPPKVEDRCYEGGRCFYKKANPGEKVAKLYYREGLTGQEIMLFDPANYVNGKTLSIQGIKPSYDGKKILVWYSENGAEISTIKILDVDKKIFLPDTIFPSWQGGISWAFDNMGFTYFSQKTDDFTNREFGLNTKTKFHKIGDKVQNDIDFFSTESYPGLIDSTEIPLAGFNKDSKKYFFADIWSTRTEMYTYYAPLKSVDQKLNWKALCKPEDGIVKTRIIIDDDVYAISSKNAKKYKLLHTTLLNPDWDKADVIAKEKSDKTLEFVTRCKDFLILTYSDGINHTLLKYDLKNKITSDIQMPISGVTDVSCLNNSTNQCIIAITSWTRPSTEFMFDAKSNLFSPSLFRKEPVVPKEYEDLVVEEVNVKGHDGEMIPLSIIYKKGLKKDGQNICLMEGYGAYGISFTPNFNKKQLPLVAYYNVIIAVAHIRGGSEKGEDWHRAGMKTNKPNSWKDLNSCAEYLIKKGFTSSDKLASIGSSAGGLMLSRAITERPDLYAVAICNVSVPNILRIESMQSGGANAPEFGSVKDSAEFRGIVAMDALHHVTKGVFYPAVICVGGWNDPRVPVWQGGKFAAALQNSTASNKPILMKVNYDNGHSTEDKEVTFKNFADQFAFAMWQCGHLDFKLKKTP